MVNAEGILQVFIVKFVYIVLPASVADCAERTKFSSLMCAPNALHSQQFPTWVTRAYDLAGTYNSDMGRDAQRTLDLLQQ